MNNPRVMSPRVLRVEITPTGGRRWHCEVPFDLTPLEGHFRDFPLVAGVCQLRWVTDCYREWTGEDAAVQQLVRLKFQQFLRPGDPFCITLERRGDAVHFALTHDQTQYASGRLVLRQ
ncbi:MAG: hypothetical protein GX146_12450 [Myxococcales bacterium]|nr:hypothetical protein [Myxococcales bacterium]